jgi:V-type H+-transporting ATPase subunit a
MIFKSRYLLLLLGFFSLYCGLIYNDFMGLKMLTMKSCYIIKQLDGSMEFDRTENCTYPIGFDWIWGASGNEITYTNSFKMKLSIIIGVLHMTLGIIFKGKLLGWALKN